MGKNTDKEDQQSLLHGVTNNSYESEPIAAKLPPKDKYNLVYILFFNIGVGLLLPWNAFITAHEYFRYKFHNSETIQNTFENAFSVGSQFPCTLALIVNIYFTGKISRKLRAILTLVLSAICFIVTDVFVYVDTFSWTKPFFGITLILVIIINTCSGILQGTMFGIAGATSPRYLQATVVGMSVGGIIVALCSTAALAFGNHIKQSALVYFTIAVLVIVICLFSYISLVQTEIYEYYLKPSANIPPFVKQKTGLFDASVEVSIKNSITANTWQVFKRIHMYSISICMIYSVSLSLMPAVISNIESVNKSNGSDWTNKYFSALVCFVIFNCGDFAGRVAAGNFVFVKEGSIALPILCLLRIVFIPLFMFCNYQPRHRLPVYFNHDFIPILLNILMSSTNGYLTALCMMFGPQQVADEYKEKAGVIMQLSLSVGLCFGAAFSYAYIAII